MVIRVILMVSVLASTLVAEEPQNQCRVIVTEISKHDNVVDERISYGSGIVIDNCKDEQRIITCNHIFDGRFNKIECKFPGKPIVNAKLVDFDEKCDLAAIAIRNLDINPAISDDSDTDVGNNVVASGFADGRYRPTPGHIVDFGNLPEDVKIKCGIMRGAVRHGDSGGPVLKDGRVVGVVFGAKDDETYFTCGGPLRSFINRVKSRIGLVRHRPTTTSSDEVIIERQR